MTTLTDSSELREALRLFQDLLSEQLPTAAPAGRGAGMSHGLEEPAPPAAPTHPWAASRAETPTVAEQGSVPFDLEPVHDGALSGVGGALPDDPFPVEEEAIEGRYRSDRLENVLVSMCRRGGFTGAVVTDALGFPLAVFNSPVEYEHLAAFTSILGGALLEAGRFLQQHGAEYISMDINYEETVVVRRFAVASQTFFLLVLCAQSIDERPGLELSVDHVVSILG